MDSIVGFLKVDSMQFVLVIVDRFSKYVVFVVVSNTCMADVAVELFHKHYVKYFGVPKDIISNRNTMFTGRFWTMLFKLSSELKFSIANHR